MTTDGERQQNAMTETPIILFGGKGGVGKTTCAAAVAARFADAGNKTIIMTSDLTPSLSDIFEERIGDAVTPIAENLSAIEIGQDAIVARWKKKFSRDFYDILSQLIDLDALDSESRHQLLDYIGSAPSLREETMLDLIVDTVEAGNYDRIVWDTAPAGETLNLLNMPKFIRKHLRAGARVFEGLDRIGRRITGTRSISDTMDEWIALSERIARFIQSRSKFVVVANPEALVVRHAERLIGTLREYDLSLQGLVINRIMEHPDSPSMESLSRTQHQYVADLKRMAGSLPVAILPYSLQEIKGRKTLREAGELLCRQLKLT
jgi:arsenite-transporting ATPase